MVTVGVQWECCKPIPVMKTGFPCVVLLTGKNLFSSPGNPVWKYYTGKTLLWPFTGLLGDCSAIIIFFEPLLLCKITPNNRLIVGRRATTQNAYLEVLRKSYTLLSFGPSTPSWSKSTFKITISVSDFAPFDFTIFSRIRSRSIYLVTKSLLLLTFEK